MSVKARIPHWLYSRGDGVVFEMHVRTRKEALATLEQYGVVNPDVRKLTGPLNPEEEEGEL